MEEKGKNGVQQEKISANQASQAVAWGLQSYRRAAEPVDMPLMPPFHDTRFWCSWLVSRLHHFFPSPDYLSVRFLNSPTPTFSLLFPPIGAWSQATIWSPQIEGFRFDCVVAGKKNENKQSENSAVKCAIVAQRLLLRNSSRIRDLQGKEKFEKIIPVK